MTDVELGSPKKDTAKEDGRIREGDPSCWSPFTKCCWDPFVRTCSKHRKRLAIGAITFLVLAVFGSIWGAAAWIQSDKALSFPSETIEFSEITSLFDEWKSGKNPPRYKIDNRMLQ